MPTPRPAADPKLSSTGEDKARKATLDPAKGHITQSGHSRDMYQRDSDGEFMGNTDRGYGGGSRVDNGEAQGGIADPAPKQVKLFRR